MRGFLKSLTVVLNPFILSLLIGDPLVILSTDLARVDVPATERVDVSAMKDRLYQVARMHPCVRAAQWHGETIEMQFVMIPIREGNVVTKYTFLIQTISHCRA